MRYDGWENINYIGMYWSITTGNRFLVLPRKRHSLNQIGMVLSKLQYVRFH